MNRWKLYIKEAREKGRFSSEAKHDVMYWVSCAVGHADSKFSGYLTTPHASTKFLSPHVIELGNKIKDFVLSDNVKRAEKIYHEIVSIERKKFYSLIPYVTKTLKKNKTFVIYTCPVCNHDFKRINSRCPNCREFLEWSK